MGRCKDKLFTGRPLTPMLRRSSDNSRYSD